MNHFLFISDLHLHDLAAQKTRMFVRFLEEQASRAQGLYILGDLFEAWIGDDFVTEFSQKVQLALKKCTSSGVPVYLMRGNRDFLLGKKFVERTGCILIDDPISINFYGRTTVLTHGDLLCTNDHSLRWFRKYANNRKLHKYFLALPVFMRKFLAQQIRTKSKKDTELKTDKIKGVDQTAMLNLMRQCGAEQLIHGHVHKTAWRKFNFDHVNNCRYITLGAWDDEPNYLVYYENHDIKLVF